MPLLRPTFFGAVIASESAFPTASLSTYNRKGETPFDVLASNGTHSEAKWAFMKALGFDPNARFACGHTLFIHFIIQKRTDDALWLLDHGADPRVGDDNESLPLAYAAAHKNDALVLKLIQRGAPLSSRDKDGDTPMAQSLIDGAFDQAQLLLKHGAKPEDAFRGDYKAWKKLADDQADDDEGHPERLVRDPAHADLDSAGPAGGGPSCGSWNR